jgi:parallel beta-helix repeat protein
MSQVEPRTPVSAATTPGDADSLYRITAPGSYYLTGNITGQEAKHGIEIASGGVTIDLRGFDLYGGGDASLDGIRTAAPNLVNITITNGSVRSWGGDGIDLATEPSGACRIENVSASLNGRTGILAGSGAVVARCAARSNGLGGAYGMAGISVGTAGVVSECAAELNTGPGIIAGPGATVSSSGAHANTLDGIRVFHGSTVTACAAHSNSLTGISCTTVPPDGNGSTITGCTAHSNAVAGIRIYRGGAAINCTVRGNGTGISCGPDSVARGNTCTANTGAGVSAGLGGVVIDSNMCTGNGVGVESLGAGVLIVRNTCALNAVNWSIAPGNRIGSIVHAGVNAAPISGSAAPGTLATTDPFANITY